MHVLGTGPTSARYHLRGREPSVQARRGHVARVVEAAAMRMLVRPRGRYQRASVKQTGRHR